MRAFLLFPLMILVLALPARALPPGFGRQFVAGQFDLPVGVTFDDGGRMYVWERAGRVWIVENNAKLAVPLIDISDEVGNWGDHGLLGFALHPNFLKNGWIYLFYAVDHYHLMNAGSPTYDPNASETDVPSIARITRYTARAEDGFHSVDPASRVVLLGEGPGTGCPLVHTSHGVGSLVFGEDGTLLASCGDGASFIGTDVGGGQFGAFTTQALAEGIIAPREDIGAYRAQLLSSLAGKILRLDPRTGDGVSSNPFYDGANPRSARSRVFALGMRNAFRFTLRPNSGSHDPAVANPGALYVGNVGWFAWEEFEVVKTPGYNSGWPLFEGPDVQPNYSAVRIANQDAPNPLFDGATCLEPFFAFGDLIVQDTLGTPSYPNRCNPAVQVPESVPRFVNRRAGLSYFHDPNGPMVTPTFTGGIPTAIGVGVPGSPVSGVQFGGYTASGITWYDGTDFPAEYQHSVFAADYSIPKLANIHYDADDKPVSVALFDETSNGVVSLATNPTTGGLYAVELEAGTVYRITYQSSDNKPPVAEASAAPPFGQTPLAVQFTGSGSTDPESQPLTYSWNFGDGTAPSPLADPIHFYFGPVGVPTVYTATLTVRDPANQTSSTQVRVYVNGIPPEVTITSPLDQSLYPLGGTSVRTLSATLADTQYPVSQLACAWRKTLHHNGHLHVDPIDPSCTTTAQLEALGCDGNDFSYTFALTVTDPAGLSTTREVSVFPDCASLLPPICGNLDGNASRNLTDMGLLRARLARTGPTPSEFSRCSVIGADECDIVDLMVLRRYLSGRIPGIEPVCPAAQP